MLKDSEKMDDDSDDLFIEKKEMRKNKRDKKRSHRDLANKDELSKESFKKMKREIEEMRKREVERTRELEDLKKKIETQQLQSKEVKQDDFALDFEKEKYLGKRFIESAKWIKDVVAKNMTEKMLTEENRSRFDVFLVAKQNSKHLGVRTCARFNRGEHCSQGKWHMTHIQPSGRPEVLWTRHRHGTNTDEDNTRANEVRLHACTLCIEPLGAAHGHGILDCPWILEKNWKDSNE